MIAKHIPGTWVRNGRFIDSQSTGRAICSLLLNEHDRINEPNANLIAAAPDLLVALKLAHEALSNHQGYAQGTTAGKIRAAIVKAEGQP